MKKLMFAVVAMTAGVCLSDITSQNIVGYAGNTLCEGAKMVGSQFLGIGTEGGAIELQSLKCRNEDSEQVGISILNELGITQKNYLWINWYGESGDEECWVDLETYEKPAEPVYFQPGQALWMQGNSTANTVTSSGEVGTKDITVTLCEGATMVANQTPVAIELQDIICRNEDSEQVGISILNELGITQKNYLWINWYGESGDEECWVDLETYEKPAEPVYFQPGEGLWVQGTSTDNQITMPGVEL